MHAHTKQIAPFWTVALATLTLGLASSFAFTVSAEQEKTSKDGVFSDAQAKRGETLYVEQCAACHAADLSGGGAPQLAGSDFLGFWGGTPIEDLVEKIQASMPASSPGSLSRAQSADITAYMLQVNKHPAGANDLPSDAAVLKTIKIAK